MKKPGSSAPLATRARSLGAARLASMPLSSRPTSASSSRPRSTTAPSAANASTLHSGTSRSRCKQLTRQSLHDRGVAFIVGTLAYVLERERVLMVHRNARADDEQLGKYNGLGGKLERDEDVVTGIRRELAEEAEIDAR